MLSSLLTLLNSLTWWKLSIMVKVVLFFVCKSGLVWSEHSSPGVEFWQGDGCAVHDR